VFFDFEQAVREVEQLEQRSGFQVDPGPRWKPSPWARCSGLRFSRRFTGRGHSDSGRAHCRPHAHEVQEFFSALRQLRAEGKSIIIITHKLYEVMEIADRCTVLRDGQLIAAWTRTKPPCSSWPA
jgi:simple sugar transport system ATP-binding protein